MHVLEVVVLPVLMSVLFPSLAAGMCPGVQLFKKVEMLLGLCVNFKFLFENIVHYIMVIVLTYIYIHVGHYD